MELMSSCIGGAPLDGDREHEPSHLSPLMGNGNGDGLHQGDTLSSISSKPSSSSLSAALLFLFAVNGFSLSLPLVALMYLVNTRVAVPVSMLSTYGALAFLPFSLKPVYALLSNYRFTWRESHHRIPRDTLIAALLLANALSNIGSAFLPDKSHKSSLLCCFLFALFRGIFTAWPEFLLGLTLLDQATAAAFQSVQQEMDERVSFGNLATRFQAEAATARNFGALVAQLLALAILTAWSAKENDTATGSVISDAMVVVLMSLTAGANLVGAVVVLTSRVGVVRPKLYEPVDNVGVEGELHTQQGTERQTTELPGASSSDQALSGIADQGTESAITTISALPRDPDNTSNAYSLILLQAVIVLFALKEPIQLVAPRWVLIALAICLAILLFVRSFRCLLAYSIDAGRQSKLRTPFLWTTVHRTGLFLVLRHALPSAESVLDSFIYEKFSSISASFLQFEAIYGTLVTLAASWSFGKIWGSGNMEAVWLNTFVSYCGGTRIQFVIAVTTLVAAVASLANIPLVHFLQTSNGVSEAAMAEGMLSSSKDVGEGKTNSYRLLAFVLTIAVKTVVAFSGSWCFLPDVILATMSVKASLSGSAGCESTSNAVAEGARLLTATRLADDNNHSSLTPEPCARPEDAEKDEPPDTEREVESLRYATLMSCLDFGDQLGALASGPLVLLFGISRENDWHSLDALVVTCFLGTLASLCFVVILR
jgi:hypothetical protein